MMAKRLARCALALFYGAAGALHLARPEAFLAIMPDFVPWPQDVILLTGLCEIAGAAGLMLPRWRKAAGLGLALYALMVFPANVKHAIEGIETAWLPQSWWYHAPRLALQPVLIWLALWASGWPVGWRRGDLASRGRDRVSETAP